MANYHVSGNRSSGYQVKREGAQRPSGHFDTKSEAEHSAKDKANASGGGEVRLHGADGRITDSDTVKPAKDPCPPKDKKF